MKSIVVEELEARKPVKKEPVGTKKKVTGPGGKRLTMVKVGADRWKSTKQLRAAKTATKKTSTKKTSGVGAGKGRPGHTKSAEHKAKIAASLRAHHAAKKKGTKKTSTATSKAKAIAPKGKAKTVAKTTRRVAKETNPIVKKGLKQKLSNDKKLARSAKKAESRGGSKASVTRDKGKPKKPASVKGAASTVKKASIQKLDKTPVKKKAKALASGSKALVNKRSR